MTLGSVTYRATSTASVASLVARVRAELGALNVATCTDATIIDWLNDGLAAIGDGYTDEAFVDLSWAAADSSVALPADLVDVVRIETDDADVLPAHRPWAGRLIFEEPTEVEAGSVRLLYAARWSPLAAAGTTTVPRRAQAAIVAYGACRYCRWVLNDRATWNRFNLQTNQNQTQPQDILQMADVHRREFEAIRDELLFRRESALTYTEQLP